MKNLFRYRQISNILSIASLVVFLFVSCRKNDEADILSYKIAGKEASVNIDQVNKAINVSFSESTTSANQIAADFTLSDGAKAYLSGQIQRSGETLNNYEVPFTYLIKAEDGKNSARWSVTSLNNSTTLSWGLGGFLQEFASNERAYSWYLDQGNTGTYSYSNCGPASTTMAAKWSDAVFNKTPEDARSAYRSAGGWWYTPDIHNWLLDNGIPHQFVQLSTDVVSTRNILKSYLVSGLITIICVDMDKVRNESADDKRIDKFYKTSPNWGHFLVVKGFKKVGDIFFFEIYDPYSLGVRYTSGELKGLNRYYRAEDIYYATSIWWNNAIVIYKKGTKSAIDQDISSFPIAWGR
jgi:hypothetical protein